MNNPQYLVNISYSRPYMTSQQNIQMVISTGPTVSGTVSVPVYGGGYFSAAMPEVGISATGSDYATALSNLLIIATASTTNSTYTPLN